MKSGNRTFPYLAILAVCFFSFFINNGTIPADLMESRNLATAQEMVATGNYLLPTMNGELRLEKPPLPTWIAAGIESVSPYNLPAQRAAAGVAGTFMVLFLFLLVRRFSGEENMALMAALILATCFNPVMMGRTATWDIYCHCFMMGAILFLVKGFDSPGKRWGMFLLSGLFMGLSFLGKGPVSFFALLLPFLIAYFVVIKPSVRGKLWPVVSMVAVCLVVSLWWPLYIAVFHPEIGLAVAAKESGSWLSHNVRPVWYYWQFPAEAGIWAFFWVTSLVYFFIGKRTEHRVFFRMSVVWTLAAFVLLSLMPEKKTRYLLPLVIPGAINMAVYVWYSLRELASRRNRVLFRINGTLIAIIALLLPVAMFLLFSKYDALHLPTFVVSSALFLAIGVYVLVGSYSRKGILPANVLAGTVLAMCCFMAFCYGPATRLFLNDQRHSIALLRDNAGISGLQFYYPERDFLRMELVYESGRTILPMDTGNDSLMAARAPFVLVCAENDPLPADEAVEAECLGRFDNNWKKTDSRRYNDELVKKVYLVKGVKR